MAEHAYQLNIRIKTPRGEDLAGQFFLGSGSDIVHELFNRLEGQDINDTVPFIYFELAEIENELPVNLKIIACNLEEAGRNVKLVLKHLFACSLL